MAPSSDNPSQLDDPNDDAEHLAEATPTTSPAGEQLDVPDDPAEFLERVMSAINHRTGPAYEHYHRLRQSSDRVFSLEREEERLQTTIREAQARLATVEADLRTSRDEVAKYSANQPKLTPADLVDLSDAHRVVLEKMQQVLRDAKRKRAEPHPRSPAE